MWWKKSEGIKWVYFVQFFEWMKSAYEQLLQNPKGQRIWSLETAVCADVE